MNLNLTITGYLFMGFNLPGVFVVGGTDVFRSWNSLNCILFVLRYGFSG